MEFTTALLKNPDMDLNILVSCIVNFINLVISTTTWDQIALGVCGVTAIWLSQDARENRQKWAPVVGLCGQPFWLYTTYSKDLWVMFLICCLYTLSWWKGFKRWHLKN